MRTLVLLLAASALAAPAAAHEASKGKITVVHPLVRASLGKVPNTAAYFVIRNSGATPDRLVGASCACAAKAQIHTTASAGAVARMTPVSGLTVPAGGEIALKPGAEHLMLTGVKRPIEAGTMVTLTLRFEKAGVVTVPFFATARIEQELAAHREHGHH